MFNTIQPIKGKKNLQIIGFLMISISVFIILFSSIDFSFLTDYSEKKQREEKQAKETIYHITPAIEPDSTLNAKKIRRVQLLLNHSGFSYPKISVNGKYDDETKKAVKKIQKDGGLLQTGIIDSKVYKILEEYAGLKRENNSSSLNYNGICNIVYKENDGSINSETFQIRQKQNEAYITGNILSSNKNKIVATFYGSVNDETKKIVLMSTSKNFDYICFFTGEIKEDFVEGTYECFDNESIPEKDSGKWTMIKN